MEDEVGVTWRQADILAKSARVDALDTWIEQTTDLVEMLAEDSKFVTELRSAAGAVRTKRNDIYQEVESLKAELIDRNRNLEAT